MVYNLIFWSEDSDFRHIACKDSHFFSPACRNRISYHFFAGRCHSVICVEGMIFAGIVQNKSTGVIWIQQTADEW